MLKLVPLYGVPGTLPGTLWKINLECHWGCCLIRINSRNKNIEESYILSQKRLC